MPTVRRVDDVFGGAKPIHQALARFKAEGRGVLIFAARWHCGRAGRFYTEVRRKSSKILASLRSGFGLSGFGIEIAGTELVEG